MGENPSAELAECQRYYQRISPAALGEKDASGYVNYPNYMWFTTRLPVTMRSAPTPSTRGSAIDWYIHTGNNTYYAMSTDLTLTGRPDLIYGYATTASSLTTGWAGQLAAASGYSGYVQATSDL